LVGRDSGADGERQQWSGGLGGARRDNSAVGDGSFMRRRGGFSVEQREKREGHVGAGPGGLKRGGGGFGQRACGVGPPAGSGGPLKEAGGGRAPWPEQGRKWGADKWASGLQC
jgi:hypothetical protein